MNVLSLFDGMSCGQQALERAEIKVENYFASEIDKYAIQVTMANYPNTIQLGSVVNVDGTKLPQIDLLIGGSPCQSFSFAGKRKGMATTDEQEILTLEHYLKLKAEGYEFEGQSYLFWEFMRLLNEVKPKYFLLENVEMGEKWERVLTQAIGVHALHINSALVSAQNRKRIYFTNIGMEAKGLFGNLESIIQKPKDRKILLKDILESEVDEKYFLSERMLKNLRITNETNNIIGHSGSGGQKGIIHNTEGQSSTLCATDYKQPKQIMVYNTNAVEVIAMRGQPNKEGGYTPKFETNNSGKSNCLTTCQKENLLKQSNAVEIKLKKPNVQIQKTINKNIFLEGEIKALDFYNQSKHDKCPTLADPSHGHIGLIAPTKSTNAVEVREVKQLSTNNKSNGGTQPYQQDRIYDVNGISPALSAGKSDLIITRNAMEVIGCDYRFDEGFRFRENGKSISLPARGRVEGKDFSGQALAKINSRIRRLTPIECERLQTVKDNYTNYVSDSQRYKVLGNGWTIEVISHIFKYIL